MTVAAKQECRRPAVKLFVAVLKLGPLLLHIRLDEYFRGSQLHQGVLEQRLHAAPILCARTHDRNLCRLDPGVYGAAGVGQELDRRLDRHGRSLHR